MTRFSDELRGSEGEWAMIQSRTELGYARRAIIRAVHDDGQKVTVQFEDDESTALVWYWQVELEGVEV